MNTEEKIGILSAVLDVPTPLKQVKADPVKVEPKNAFEKLLISLKLKKPVYEPRCKMLYIEALKLSTNYRLTAISNSLVVDSDKEGATDKIMDVMHSNIYLMATYVATAIHNDNSETPEDLIHTVASEFTNQELKITMEEVYRRLDVQSFFGCTALVRNLALM